MTEINPTCANCMYCGTAQLDSNLQRQSICMRFPPQVLPVPTQHGMSMQVMHPPVREDMTCGEWTPNEELRRNQTHER